MNDNIRLELLFEDGEEITLEELARGLDEWGYGATGKVVRSWVRRLVWRHIDSGKLEFTLDRHLKKV